MDIVQATNILTLGCHLSYCALKFFPIVSRAFGGAIEKGSVNKGEYNNEYK